MFIEKYFFYKNNKLNYDKIKKEKANRIHSHFFFENHLKNKKESMFKFIDSLDNNEVNFLNNVDFRVICKNHILRRNGFFKFIKEDITEDFILNNKNNLVKILEDLYCYSDEEKEIKSNFQQRILTKSVVKENKFEIKNKVIQSI